MAALLGIDVGTSSSKAIVIDARGTILGVGTAPHPTFMPRDGWSEQDPRDWWASARAAVARAVEAADITGDRVDGIGLSGQMHGSVLLDRATIDAAGARDSVLRRAILWNDQRTGSQCVEIERRAGGRRELVSLVGNAALPGFTLPKWLWVREHEPDVWDRVAAAVMPKDYIRFRLTGTVGTDVGDAAGTLALDVEKRTWSREVPSLFGIDPGILPEVVESGRVAGQLTEWAARAMGLRAGTPVVAGSGDNQCGAIGAGVVEQGLMLATLGTSGVIYAHADIPRRDLGSAADHAGRVHTMCAADGDGERAGHWSITGCTLSAGGALAWAREAIFGGESYDVLLDEAERVSPGCEGLVFLPYLTGERCPHPDPSARGAWIGLTARHTRGHLVRAILEGVALTMQQILGIVREVRVEVGVCRVGGGGTRSPLWRGILAAALDLPVQVMETEEGPAHGAALLGGVGAGVWESVPQACRAAVRVKSQEPPNPDLAHRYRELGRVHEECYADLRDRFRALGSLE